VLVVFKVRSQGKLFEKYTSMSDFTGPKLNLKYFPFSGRAGPIRQALQFGQVPYTDTHIGREFPELQASGVWPFDSLPVLEVGEGEDMVVLSQCNAILNYVGKFSSLYPSDPLVAVRAETVLCAIESFVDTHLQRTMRFSGDEKKTAREAIAAGPLPFLFDRLQRHLNANPSKSGFMSGPDLSVADVKALAFYVWMTNGSTDYIPTTCMDAYPDLVAHRATTRQALLDAGVTIHMD